MKSRKRIYILLLLVLIIWGLLVYRLFSFFGNDETIVDDNLNFQSQNTVFKAPDSIRIVVDYRDPFTGSIREVRKKAIPTIIKHNPPAENTSTVSQEMKPIIIYKGLVSDIKDKRKVFMFSVDSKMYLLENGQIENNIKVVSGDAKQITLLIDKKKEVVAISK